MAGDRQTREMMKAAKQPDEMDAQLDKIVEIQPTHRVNVPQTNTLYRLIPAASDTARSRQIAVVAAENEARARALATSHDPFGRDWRDEALFLCQVEIVAEPNVVGDVMFESIPATPDKHRKVKSAK